MSCIAARVIQKAVPKEVLVVQVLMLLVNMGAERAYVATGKHDCESDSRGKYDARKDEPNGTHALAVRHSHGRDYPPRHSPVASAASRRLITRSADFCRRRKGGESTSAPRRVSATFGRDDVARTTTLLFMDSPEIDWELQERGMAVFQAAAAMFGERRFARGRLPDQGASRPILEICAVDPTQAEIVELDHAAKNVGFGLVVHCVRYSYEDLLAFYRSLGGEDLSGDVLVSYGVDDIANVIRFRLRRLDPSAMAYVRDRLPADAIRFEIEPRAGHWVAA